MGYAKLVNPVKENKRWRIKLENAISYEEWADAAAHLDFLEGFSIFTFVLNVHVT